jgi:hypothetical protein
MPTKNVIYDSDTTLIQLIIIIYKKGVLQLALQLNFWVTLDICNSLHLYAMSVIGQVTRIARVASHHIYIWCNSLQLYYNFVTTTPFQLLCNSPMTTIIMSCWCHFSSIHQNFNTWHYEDFSWFFWNIDIHCPLWLFILDGFGLWHMAQSKVAMWHINWILENKYIYVPK